MAKGGKGKAKKSKNSATVDPNNTDHIDPATKAFFKVQLKDLEEKLERSENKCEILTIENEKFRVEANERENIQKNNFEGYKKLNGDSQGNIQGLKRDIIGMVEKIESFKLETSEKFENYRVVLDINLGFWASGLRGIWASGHLGF